MASRLPVGTWILCFIVVCGVAGSAHAVDRLVPQEYPTIQEGINAAQTGDIVLVSPGVYNELIDFLGKTITVRSTDGPAVTIIDGGGNGPIVTFQNLEGPGSVLEGFTITNGVAAEGAGITILDAYPTILNNTISSNTATTGSGGGILMRAYTPNIDASLIPLFSGNIISGNLAMSEGGGGLYVYSRYDSPQINQNQIIQNEAYAGGAISLRLGLPSSTAQISENQIQENTANGFTGGILLNGPGSFDLSINDISANVLISDTFTSGAAITAGAYSYGDSRPKEVRLNSNIITQNTGGRASAIFTSTKKAVLAGNSILNNGQYQPGSMLDGDYHAIWFEGVDDLVISGSTIANNNVSQSAAYIFYPDNIFIENSTLSVSQDSPEFTYALYAYGSGSRGNVVVNNNVVSGGPLSFYSYYYGGSGRFSITDNNFISSALSLDAYLYQDTILDVSISKNSFIQSSASLFFNSYGYYGSNFPTTNTEANIQFNDNVFSQSPGTALSIRALSDGGPTDWQFNVDIKNLLISNLTSPNEPVIKVLKSGGTYNAGYPTDIIHNTFVSMNNVLIDQPLSDGPIVSITTDGFESSGSTPQDTFQVNVALDHVTALSSSNSPAVSVSLGDVVSGTDSILESTLTVENSIIRGSEALDLSLPDTTSTSFKFSNFSNAANVSGVGLIDEEPVFVSGPFGSKYLSSISAGNSADSPGLDAGDPNAPAPFLGGTRADGGIDTGVKDMGYHYPTRIAPSSIHLEVDDTALYYEPGTGIIDASSMSLFLTENLPEGSNQSSWRGVSLRLLQESGSLQIASVNLAQEFLDSLGSSPEYFEALICDDVVTIGIIPSLTDPSLTFAIFPMLELLQFEVTAGPDLLTSHEIMETQWIPQDGPGCGGILDVNNLVTDSLGNTTPLSRQPIRITLVPRPLFIRGDANADGQSNLGDAVALLSLLFNGFDALKCDDASDINDDGLIDIADPINLLAALFTSGSPPPSPGQACGPDPTADLLRCESYEVCTPPISLTSFSATTSEPEVVQLSWETAGPVDQVQIYNNGIVHQRLAGTATGTKIRSLPAGLQEICLWVLAGGQIIEECVSVITSQPVTDLTCRMDAQSPDAILQWVPQPGVDQLEIYSGSNLLAVVNAEDLTAQIAVPQNGVLDLCLIGVTGQAVSTSICCQIQTNDECYGAIPLTLGTTYNPFLVSTISSDFYDSSQCLDCWDNPPNTFFNNNGGDIWHSYIADQSGVLMFDHLFSAEMVIYEGDCSSLSQRYCGSLVARHVEAGDQFLIRLVGWLDYNFIFDLNFIDALPNPFFNCNQGYDIDSGLYRVSWRVYDFNVFETMTVTVDGLEVGSVAGTDGTFLIPGLVSGTTYEICIMGQTGSLVSSPACQTVTIP